VTTPPSIDLIRCPQLAPRAPYAYAAVTHDVGRFVFTAGACPLDEAGNTVAVGDVVGQAEQVMANLQIALRAADAELTDVIKTTVYVASQQRADLVAAWEVVRRHLGHHDAPSTLLGVSVLGYRDQLVEVEAVAACDDSDRSGRPISQAERQSGRRGQAQTGDDSPDRVGTCD
jgi:enamine deaminase RidA (YjgF/YER057c/UK114 family)